MNSINEKCCPFCKADNQCQAQADTPCWCARASFPSELLALVPDALKNRSCICPRCIQEFNGDPVDFRVRYLRV